jgi:hypothetical protein
MRYPRRHPGINHQAPRPSLYTRPAVPRIAQPLSELAVEEMAVNQCPSLRSARKKSDTVRVNLDAIRPIANMKTI